MKKVSQRAEVFFRWISATRFGEISPFLEKNDHRLVHKAKTLILFSTNLQYFLKNIQLLIYRQIFL
jgi:hypothetical protein